MKKILGALAVILALSSSAVFATEQQVEKKEDAAVTVCKGKFQEGTKEYDECLKAEQAKAKQTSQTETGEKKVH